MMLKAFGLKPCYVLSLGILLSCGAVKDVPVADGDKQLLKDLEVLSSDAFEGRKTGTKGADMARVYLNQRFIEIGLKPLPGLHGFEQDFSFGATAGTEIKGKNMLAYLPGKTDSIIVISAHYDHLGIGKNGIYNGADDNASGVAALLKIAGYFKKNKPVNTLVFAAFDAEEMGLQGAKAFVKNPSIELSRVKLNINMDMISHNDRAELYACGTYKYPQFKKYFLISSPNIKILFGHDQPATSQSDWTNQSDQAAFDAKNIPFIYFGVEDHKDYHKTSDKYENINKAFFINAANSIQEITDNIDKGRDAKQMFKDKLQMKKQ